MTVLGSSEERPKYRGCKLEYMDGVLKTAKKGIYENQIPFYRSVINNLTFAFVLP